MAHVVHILIVSVCSAASLVNARIPFGAGENDVEPGQFPKMSTSGCGEDGLVRIADLAASTGDLREALADARLSAQELRDVIRDVIQNVDMRQIEKELRLLLNTRHSLLEERIEELRRRVEVLEESGGREFGGKATVPGGSAPVAKVTPPPSEPAFPASPVVGPDRILPEASSTVSSTGFSPEQEKALGEALIEAAKRGLTDEVRRLLAEGADPGYADVHQATALHRAALEGHLEVVQLLLEAGANVDVVNTQGHTPLHWASKFGREEVVQALLRAGASVDARNWLNETPLHFAARSNHQSVARMLLAAGADPWATDVYNRAP